MSILSDTEGFRIKYKGLELIKTWIYFILYMSVSRNIFRTFSFKTKCNSPPLFKRRFCFHRKSRKIVYNILFLTLKEAKLSSLSKYLSLSSHSVTSLWNNPSCLIEEKKVIMYPSY